jgi:hypothetical protein
MKLSRTEKKTSHTLVAGLAGGLAYVAGALGAGHFPGWKALLVGFACAAVSRIAGSLLARIDTA